MKRQYSLRKIKKYSKEWCKNGMRRFYFNNPLTHQSAGYYDYNTDTMHGCGRRGLVPPADRRTVLRRNGTQICVTDNRHNYKRQRALVGYDSVVSAGERARARHALLKHKAKVWQYLIDHVPLSTLYRALTPQ